MFNSIMEKIELYFWKRLTILMSESFHARLLIKSSYRFVNGDLRTQFLPRTLALGGIAFGLGLVLTLIIL
jgi:hypothetical protein